MNNDFSKSACVWGIPLFRAKRCFSEVAGVGSGQVGWGGVDVVAMETLKFEYNAVIIRDVHLPWLDAEFVGPVDVDSCFFLLYKLLSLCSTALAEGLRQDGNPL